MKVIGLTGGIGMGKSTADKLLREGGVPVVDTDIIARQLVEADQPALHEIRKEFGPGIIGSDGHLRRDELARIVFGDATKLKKLEGILHPRIRQTWLDQVAQLSAASKAVAVVVIPLLFETSAEKHFQAIICVACSAPTQRRRLLKRGWTPEMISQRNAAQWSIEQKISRSDFVVWTEGSLEVDSQQLHSVLKSIG
jgi:dephospho-CoA kinase